MMPKHGVTNGENASVDDQYRCGTCGSQELVVTAIPDAWVVSCGEGHVITPVPGTIIEIRTRLVMYGSAGFEK